MFDNENIYNGKFVEDVREKMGNIIGIVNIVSVVLFIN